ncbi:MAG: competence protein ComEC [Paenibacillus sp.]|nr:competence protein ComEC [Paenibacillus sp.]
MLVSIVWVVGTAVGSHLPSGLLSWKLFALSLAMAAMLALLAVPGRGIVALLLVLVAAASYYQAYDAGNVTTIPSFQPEAAVEQSEGSGEPVDRKMELDAYAIGKIISPVEVDGDKASFVMLADTMSLSGGEPIAVHDKLQVSVRLLQQPEQEQAEQLGRGDPVALRGAMKRPDTPGNFGAFDYRLYLYRNHTHWQITVKGLEQVAFGPELATNIKHGSKREQWAIQLFRWNDDLRFYLGGVFDKLFAADSADSGYLKSLVLGLTDDIEPELYGQFSQLGLTHILAISGTHVVVFVAGCMWLLRLFRLTRERMLTVTMMLVPFYVAISGGSPSAVRAGLMAMAGLYLARRRMWNDALNVIGLAAVLMLLWDPYFLFNVSFQLSFLVTLGLIVGVPRFSELLPIRNEALKSLVSVTVVAQFISFPITVYYFNGVSLLSAFANLLLVPFISFIILPFGTIVLVAGLVSVKLGSWLAWLLAKLNAATFWFIDTAAVHDPFRLIWPKPTVAWVIMYYVLLGIVSIAITRWKIEGKPKLAYAAVSALILLLAYGYNPQLFDRNGYVSFLDVGQGDAALVRTPQGKFMLIDGGGTLSFLKPGEEWKERRDPYEVGKKLLVPLLKQRGVHRIDLLVASHQDVDHIGGLQAVMEQIPVRTLLMNGTWNEDKSSRKLFETAMRKGTHIVTADTAEEGSTIRLDPFTLLTVLNAKAAAEPIQLAKEQNEQSIVLLMQMRETKMLFTGDMTMANETELLEVGAGDSAQSPSVAAVAAPIDVMKVAHHGSKTSTSEAWLAYWKPKTAVISVGLTNSYGHPNPGVLERLTAAGSEVRRTDWDGEIRMIVTKRGVGIESGRQSK